MVCPCTVLVFACLDVLFLSFLLIHLHFSKSLKTHTGVKNSCHHFCFLSYFQNVFVTSCLVFYPFIFSARCFFYPIIFLFFSLPPFFCKTYILFFFSFLNLSFFILFVFLFSFAMSNIYFILAFFSYIFLFTLPPLSNLESKARRFHHFTFFYPLFYLRLGSAPKERRKRERGSMKLMFLTMMPFSI